MITHYRLEAKIIHGQTTTVLRTMFKCDGIIVVDDLLAKDEIMKKVYSIAAPVSVKTYFYDTKRALEQLPKAEQSLNNYYVIFRNALSALELVKEGYHFVIPLTCGQQFIRENTLNVLKGLGLTEEEILALEKIKECGNEIIFDPSCNGENVSFDEMMKLIKEERRQKKERV